MSRNRRNLGRVSPALVLVAGSVVAVALLGAALFWSGRPSPAPSRQTLVVFCAAGVKPPVEAAAREFEQVCGVRVQLQYGGSGTLLGNLRVSRSGDLYIAADQSHIDLGRSRGVVAEVLPLARIRPVIAVPRGNPKNVVALKDLLRADVRVSLANPEAASIGAVTRQVLERTGDWPAVEARVRSGGVFKPTVNDIANDVRIGAADAGIVWDATVRQYPDLAMVRTPEFDPVVQQISVGVLTWSARPTIALRFARFLAARDRGAGHFEHYGYEPADGDDWAESPEIRLFSGAMLRPAIEQTLRDFERREGVRITTVYNGCGILTAQMRAGQRPDAYFACDRSFMDSVADLYLAPATVSDNDIMLIVPKGNPQNLRTVDDLIRPGVRLGLAHPEKSAMGALTKNLLVAMGQYDAVRQNAKVESATGDLLVNQLRAGSLDAIIACRSNSAGSPAHLEAIAIDHPLAKAVQPYAVGKGSRHRQTMTRLADAIRSAESRDRFQAAGFGWRAQGP